MEKSILNFGKVVPMFEKGWQHCWSLNKNQTLGDLSLHCLILECYPPVWRSLGGHCSSVQPCCRRSLGRFRSCGKRNRRTPATPGRWCWRTVQTCKQWCWQTDQTCKQWCWRNDPTCKQYIYSIPISNEKCWNTENSLHFVYAPSWVSIFYAPNFINAHPKFIPKCILFFLHAHERDLTDNYNKRFHYQTDLANPKPQF